MFKIIGGLLIINGIVIALLLISSTQVHKAGVISICLIAIFAGFFLIIQDRVIEITVKGVGTIKAAAERADIDSKAISDIKIRIEGQSATVDLVAGRAGEALELSEKATENIELVQNELNKVRTNLSATEGSLKSLSLLTVFQTVVVKAQNDDRQAYEQLSEWEKDNQYPFQQQALIAKMNIRLQYSERIRTGLIAIAPTWKEGIDQSELTISELINDYNITEWYFHPGLISYIWKRNDFSKKDRLQFLIDVLKNDRNLKAVCLAQHFLSKEADIKFNPLVIEPLLEWWEENKGNYNKNPEEHPTDEKKE